MWKRVETGIVLCALVLAGALAVLEPPTVTVGSWGLAFPQAGERPVGNEDAEALEKQGGFYVGDGSERVLYLTFDAGYENGSTAKILDVLKQKQVPATFFLAGHYMEQNADLVRRMVAEGHQVGNHTMHHPDVTKLSKAEFTREVQDLEALFTELTGEKLSPFLRPPEGRYCADTLAWTRELGYTTVFWSLAHVDWNNEAQPDPKASLEKLLSRTHPGAVVLLHSTSQTNAAILADLIDQWRSQGYEIRQLSCS